MWTQQQPSLLCNCVGLPLMLSPPSVLVSVSGVSPHLSLYEKKTKGQ